MKKLFSVLILYAAMLCGCSKNDAEEISEAAVPETSSVTVTTESSVTTVTETETTTTGTTSVAASETSASETTADKEQSEYTYSPPEAAFDVEFARDNIIYKLDYTYYRNDSTADLPEYIFSDINSYADEFISSAKYDCKLDWIGIDMFDINSDRLDDYIVVGQIMEKSFVSKQEGDAPHTQIERIYLSNGNGGFNFIDFPASCGKGGTLHDHILSTKTNGFNDFMGSSHDGILLISFDGNNTYSETEILDKDYTWEYLDNDLVRIICYDYHNKNEIAVAKLLYDTDCVEHILLYSSLPDGTPSVSIPQTYDSNKFEFYVKRTDKAPEKWNDFWIGPIEVKYIPT